MGMVVIQSYILVLKLKKPRTHKVPKLYWLPKLHTKLYKVRLIANSGSCKTTELS